MLPDRTLTYQTADGQTVTMTIKGGTGVFTVDANDGDLVRATVDNSKRDNTYDAQTKESQSTTGSSPTYDYPAIPNYQLYEDIGAGSGNGNGEGSGSGNGGNSNRGNGAANRAGSENTGNSTHSQKTDPANNANNPVNDVSQNYDEQVADSPASASESSSGADADAGSTPESVVKQIIIDEDEFYKVTGISFIILLIILTITFYYREEIREMKSKM